MAEESAAKAEQKPGEEEEAAPAGAKGPLIPPILIRFSIVGGILAVMAVGAIFLVTDVIAPRLKKLGEPVAREPPRRPRPRRCTNRARSSRSRTSSSTPPARAGGATSRWRRPSSWRWSTGRRGRRRRRPKARRRRRRRPPGRADPRSADPRAVGAHPRRADRPGDQGGDAAGDPRRTVGDPRRGGASPTSTSPNTWCSERARALRSGSSGRGQHPVPGRNRRPPRGGRDGSPGGRGGSALAGAGRREGRATCPTTSAGRTVSPRNSCVSSSRSTRRSGVSSATPCLPTCAPSSTSKSSRRTS